MRDEQAYLNPHLQNGNASSPEIQPWPHNQSIQPCGKNFRVARTEEELSCCRQQHGSSERLQQELNSRMFKIYWRAAAKDDFCFRLMSFKPLHEIRTPIKTQDVVRQNNIDTFSAHGPDFLRIRNIGCR